MFALILAGGRRPEASWLKAAAARAGLIVAADSGALHALRSGFVPQIVVGDMDSLAPSHVRRLERLGTDVRRVPSEKDWTDTELAVRVAVESGAREIAVAGAFGSRFDHALANVFLLPPLVEAGIEARLEDGWQDLRVLSGPGEATVSGEPGQFVSLQPLTREVTGVTLRGLRYPLTEHTLRWGESLGVSNELLGTSATIAVQSGWLAVCRTVAEVTSLR